MTRRRWAIAGTVYLVAQLAAIPLLPVLSAWVWGDLVPRVLAVLP